MADSATPGAAGAAPAASAAAVPNSPAPAAPAPAAASPSSSTPPAPQGGAPGASPAAPAAGGTPDPVTGQVGSAPAAPAAGTAPRLLDTLPKRGSEEYWQKFENLTQEQRTQLEKEISDVDSGLAPPPGEKPVADPNDPKAAPLPGDKPAEAADNLFLDETEVAAMPERHQKVIQAMQAEITELAPFRDETFAKGMELFMTDPLIKQRMEELTAGNPWTPNELSKEFDASAYVPADALDKLDPVTDPDGFKAFHEDIAKRAYEDGLKKGTFAKEYEMRQQIAFTERKAKFDLGFNKLADVHPELKAKDPSIREVTDARHPMNPFVKWVAANYRDDFFLKNENAFEASYASFLAAGGKLNQAIASHVNRARTDFIRKVDAAHKEAATVGRNTSSQQPDRPPLIQGVDTVRYMQDRAYRDQVFNNADIATRQKLEQLAYGNLKPQT